MPSSQTLPLHRYAGNQTQVCHQLVAGAAAWGATEAASRGWILSIKRHFADPDDVNISASAVLETMDTALPVSGSRIPSKSYTWQHHVFQVCRHVRSRLQAPRRVLPTSILLLHNPAVETPAASGCFKSRTFKRPPPGLLGLLVLIICGRFEKQHRNSQLSRCCGSKLSMAGRLEASPAPGPSQTLTAAWGIRQSSPLASPRLLLLCLRTRRWLPAAVVVHC